MPCRSVFTVRALLALFVIRFPYLPLRLKSARAESNLEAAALTQNKLAEQG